MGVSSSAGFIPAAQVRSEGEASPESLCGLLAGPQPAPGPWRGPPHPSPPHSLTPHPRSCLRCALPTPLRSEGCTSDLINACNPDRTLSAEGVGGWAGAERTEDIGDADSLC